MRREDAVNLMTKHILDMNRSMGEQQGIPELQIVHTLEQMKGELDTVNARLFDVLYEAGIINLHN
jgi:hypothetical protein